MFIEECNFQFSQNMKPGNKFIIDKFSNKEREKGTTEGSYIFQSRKDHLFYSKSCALALINFINLQSERKKHEK